MFTTDRLNVSLRQRLLKNWSVALYKAETKYFESFEIWVWIRMKKKMDKYSNK